MRLLEKMCFVVLASGLAMGQATANNSGSAGTGSVADELKALREAISAATKTDFSATTTDPDPGAAAPKPDLGHAARG